MSGTTGDVARGIVSLFKGGTPDSPGSFDVAGRTYQLLPLVDGKVPPACKRSMRRLGDEQLDRQVTVEERTVVMILDAVDPKHRARLRRDIGGMDVAHLAPLAQLVVGQYADAIRAAGGSPEDRL